MDKNDWYKVENRDGRNDFISYRMLYEGYSTEESGIKNHNMNIESAYLVCNEMMRVIESYVIKHKLSFEPENMIVGDFGGGAGFLASALSKRFKKVYSYDISEYAGKYGSANFFDVSFITQGINIGDNMKEGPFDIIIAYEFYPFTRTKEWSYGKDYIDTCLGNLSDGGILVIGLPIGGGINNLGNNWKKIRSNYKYNCPSIEFMSYCGVMRRINNIFLQRVVSKMAMLFKDKHALIVMKK